MREVFRIDALAGVLDGDLGRSPVLGGLDPDAAACWGVSDGVGEQVGEDLPEPVTLGEDRDALVA